MSIWQSYGQQQRDNFWLKVANRPVFLHQRVSLPLYHSSRLSSHLLIIVRYTGVCVYTNTLTYLLPWNSGLKQCYTRNETAQNAVVGAKLRWMIQVTARWHSRLMMKTTLINAAHAMFHGQSSGLFLQKYQPDAFHTLTMFCACICDSWNKYMYCLYTLIHMAFADENYQQITATW